MSELLKIFLTSGLTVVSGVIVFAFGHFSVSLFITPIHKLRSIISEIDDSLYYYEHVYSNTNYAEVKLKDEASLKIRTLASQLTSSANIIPWYCLWHFLHMVPPNSSIYEVSKLLRNISNEINQGHNIDSDIVLNIRDLLGFKYL